MSEPATAIEPHPRWIDGGVLFAYLLISVLMTWPLVAHLSGYTLFGGRDDQMFLWDFWWFRYSLQELHTWPLRSDWIFQPFGTGLSFHTITPLLSLLSIPLQNIWDVYVAYNLAVLAAFVCSAFSMYLLVGYLTSSKGGAFLAGIVFAFSSFRFYQSMGHLNIISAQFLPIYALFLIKMLRESRRGGGHATFAGLSLGLVFLIDYYQFVFALFLTLCYLSYYLLGRADANGPLRLRDRGTLGSLLRRLGVVAAVFVVVAAPLLYGIYIDLRDGYYVQVAGDSYSADMAAFFVPISPLFNFVPGLKQLNGTIIGGGDTIVYAGWSVIILVAVGTWRLARRVGEYRFWLVLLLLCFLFALGPQPHLLGQPLPVPGPFALWAAIPLLNNARIPARFDLLVSFAAAILVGFSARELLAGLARRASPRRWMAIVLVALSGLMLGEHLIVPLVTDGRPMNLPSYFRQIAAAPGDFAVLHLPTYDPYTTAAVMQEQTVYQKRVFAAYIARPLPDFALYYRNERFIHALSVPRKGPGQASDDVTAALANVGAMSFYRRDAAQLVYYLDIRYIVCEPKVLTPDGMRLLTASLPLEQVYSDNPDLNKANVAVFRVRQAEVIPAALVSSLDLAERTSQKFLLRGWRQPESDPNSGGGYVRMTTNAGQLLTPVREAANYTVTLTLRPAGGSQTLRLYLNDELDPAATLTLQGGDWQTQSVVVGSSHWRAGLNKVWLRMEGGATEQVAFKNITFTPRRLGLIIHGEDLAMRYYAKLEGSDEEIELDVDEDGNVGREDRAVDLLRLDEGRFSLILDGHSYELYATPTPDAPGHTSYSVSVGGRRYRVEVQSERERRIRKAAPVAHASGAVSIKAPMPGLVTNVAVAVGDTVTANQRLLLLEAMKMENEIRTPKAGTVKSISVAAGDKVEQGRVMVVIE